MLIENLVEKVLADIFAG